ncbi:hypothetical protein VOLCADRAFT_107813 [Volvox carteri f. nagariensis]|uniref:Uncharacterized protein n=1 Tax=Volvox carteri f. nagariensis TaxID=3068 RepID=D8UGM0_VOLCA|nr:uncharacterized protein VOLCADRAFT_107813 [Volvox carteri f. nagariensis]EFJ41122.1 hypothetical protein VOLCADRAFT_107813 [Volvox carteri f. nagariensis]|eukprot:XP_002957794.1 hypothetical protein VOLCADRAFT_107813 [Volvox carteri f. nagariensis]
MLTTLQRSAPVAAAASRAKPTPVRLAKPGRAVAVRVLAANFTPPTVAETKAKFFEGYSKPIASIYSTVLQELLVQQHFMRYSKDYVYNEIFALGFVSVYEQILESLPQSERDAIFVSYVKALGEDPEAYKRDSERVEKAAGALSGPDALVPDAEGSDVQTSAYIWAYHQRRGEMRMPWRTRTWGQGSSSLGVCSYGKALDAIKAASAADAFSYNKFVAIGLFRLLELTGAKEPAALERLVKSVGIKPEAVNRDLLMYKGVLSKLAAAKEMMREFVEREKRRGGGQMRVLPLPSSQYHMITNRGIGDLISHMASEDTLTCASCEGWFEQAGVCVYVCMSWRVSATIITHNLKYNNQDRLSCLFPDLLCLFQMRI